MIALPILLALCMSPTPDVAVPGFKKIRQEVAIENPDDFPGWTVVAATFLGPSHITVVEPDVPFSYSSKYGTRVFGVPDGTPIPEWNRGDPRDAFADFPTGFPPVSHASMVAAYAPTDRVLTTVRITQLDADGIQMEEVGDQAFDDQGRPVTWLRRWALPIGAIAGGLALLTWLVRRRKRRAAA
ncbi:MAG: hypothetical protein R3F17_13310 [Planctomycetota bacterium]